MDVQVKPIKKRPQFVEIQPNTAKKHVLLPPNICTSPSRTIISNIATNQGHETEENKMQNPNNNHLLLSRNVIDLLDIWKSRGKPVVLWTGAGLSIPAKLPTWLKLSEILVQESLLHASNLYGKNKTDFLGKLRAAQSTPSLWKNFELLEEVIGSASFSAIIRAALVECLRCDIPTNYITAWNLGVQGIITLNIDRLAHRAFHNSAASNNLLYERNGFDVKTLVGTLTNPTSRFIASLHGSFEEPNSWVFTERKLNALLKDSTYTEFVSDCIKYSTIILVGISAQDRAVLDHFARICSQFSNAGPHFWIAESGEADAARVLEQAGVRTILYSNHDGGHSFISELFQKVSAHNITIEEASPVIPKASKQSELLEALPTPNELISSSPNQIRNILNVKGKQILAKENDNAYKQFEAFCGEYARAIHSTTYFSKDTTEDADCIGDYIVDDYVKEGGFAKVWCGHDQDRQPVAIKVFRHEIREQPALLKAFRRGVRSMRLLENKNIPGVVRFLDAYEIPPVVIMEWINGLTLHDAVQQGATYEWSQCIKIARDLANAVFNVHNTPERIVHRDLRPQNIMLRDYYPGQDEYDVIVLDFDLSWHLGAHEKSVYVSGGTAYLAPEQIVETPGMSTRSAAVDSYGFGMTMYYMITGTDPQFFAYAKPNWQDSIITACGAKKCKEWRSLPMRVGRLIFNSTLGNQHKRLTFGQITSEIDKLYQAVFNPDSVRDLQYISEEIFARIGLFINYSHTDSGGCEYRSPSGVKYNISPYAHAPGFVLDFSYAAAGHEKYQNLHYLREEFQSLPEKFGRNYELIHKTTNTSHGDYLCSLVVQFDESPHFISNLSKLIETVAEKLSNLTSIY